MSKNARGTPILRRWPGRTGAVPDGTGDHGQLTCLTDRAARVRRQRRGFVDRNSKIRHPHPTEHRKWWRSQASPCSRGGYAPSPGADPCRSTWCLGCSTSSTGVVGGFDRGSTHARPSHFTAQRRRRRRQVRSRGSINVQRDRVRWPRARRLTQRTESVRRTRSRARRRFGPPRA